jgi:hypothetical protein
VSKDVGVIDWDDWTEATIVYPAKRVRKPRRPSIGRMIAQAEKAGKNVASITTPDGTTLTFGQAPSEAANPWLADLERMTKQ